MTLSVIVPVYNGEKTIAACLEAIRRSLFENYELIVVNDGSSDSTIEQMGSLPDKVISHRANRGLYQSRLTGKKSAVGDILVYIDADILIEPDSLSIIHSYLSSHPDTDAVTGLLAKKHPNQNFFSQYKNLYMNYIFSRLPDKVTFLYGSIFAVRRDSLRFKDTDVSIYEEDTMLGQDLIANGGTIFLAKNLEVQHLKRHSFWSWIKNDFLFPFGWAHIFLRTQGWRQLGRGGTGFAHASKGQLMSLMLIPAIGVFAVLSMRDGMYSLIAALLFLTWFGLNLPFVYFLTKSRGALFGAGAVLATFLDHLIMGVGVCLGFFSAMRSPSR